MLYDTRTENIYSKIIKILNIIQKPVSGLKLLTCLLKDSKDKKYNQIYLIDNKIVIDTSKENTRSNMHNICRDKNCKYPPVIRFHPFTQEKQSCSFLMMNDFILMYLKLKILNQFRNSIYENEKIKPHEYKFGLNTNNYKLNQILNMVDSNYFSNYLVAYEIEIDTKTSKAKVTFDYPMYNLFCTTKNNVIFGILLSEDEISLFKQIYKDDVISKISNLFSKDIKIPVGSDKYPNLYILLYIKAQLIKSYDSRTYESRFKNFIEEISNLNSYSKYIGYYSEQEQKRDITSYKAELQKRKESEPNWLLLKDCEMKKKKQQLSSNENNIRSIIDNFGNFLGFYDVKQYTKAINKLNTDILIQERKDNYHKWKNDQEWKNIFYLQNLVLNLLKTNGGGLWYDRRIKKYCFRSKLYGSVSEVDSNELGDLLTRALKEKIRHSDNYNSNLDYAMEIILVSKLKGINSKKLSPNDKSNDIIIILLFENEIISIDDDVFDPNNKNEFIKNYSDLFYTRNRFVPNEYLVKRYQDVLSNTGQTFIEEFIYHLVKENQKLSDYIVNWLAYFFQNLKKTKTALVFLGDEEVTKNIFWEIIIKEIFSKQYCIAINDEECDTALVSSIAKDKLFFHIDDINNADTKFDDITLASIVKDLLVKPSVTTDENKEVKIQGQILITAKNPAPYLKKVLSKCSVIEVNDIDTIMEKLGIEDEAELEEEIHNDLDKFTDKIANYIVRENVERRIDTDIREVLKGNKSSNINKDEIEQNIDSLIKAIKDKDIKYFEKVKGIKDKKFNDVYEHLKYAFDKECFIGQDLYLYYNAINGQTFKDNRDLLKLLKEKDDMFKQEVDTLEIMTKDGKEEVLFRGYSTSVKIDTKKLYKIRDYKLAKDIKIPDGATITSTQSNLKKYAFSSQKEKEECIKRTKEYSK